MSVTFPMCFEIQKFLKSLHPKFIHIPFLVSAIRSYAMLHINSTYGNKPSFIDSVAASIVCGWIKDLDAKDCWIQVCGLAMLRMQRSFFSFFLVFWKLWITRNKSTLVLGYSAEPNFKLQASSSNDIVISFPRKRWKHLKIPDQYVYKNIFLSPNLSLSSTTPFFFSFQVFVQCISTFCVWVGRSNVPG